MVVRERREEEKIGRKTDFIVKIIHFFSSFYFFHTTTSYRNVGYSQTRRKKAVTCVLLT